MGREIYHSAIDELARHNIPTLQQNIVLTNIIAAARNNCPIDVVVDVTSFKLSAAAVG